MPDKIIVILGSTATGKTKLAVKLAKKFNGEIVSADSRQVYKGMDIGTGKDLKDYGQVPYHLIDIVSPKTNYTLDRWLKDAKKAIKDILSRGKLPIVVGGTGLYISALTEGYVLPETGSKKPAYAKALAGKPEIRDQLDQLSLKQLLVKLKKIDPKTYKIIDKKNRRRVQRALEIYYQTGRSKSEQAKRQKPPYDFLLLGLTLPKEDLKKKIDKRIDQMIEQGLVEEIKSIKKTDVSYSRLKSLGLESRLAALYLQKEISLEEMVGELKKQTWQFAKRQLTWFKRNEKIKWIKAGEAEKLVKNFLK